MILDSSYWQNDILKLAKKLELRLIQKRWSLKSYFSVEKEIFLGFYSIRKLIESNKVPKIISEQKYQVFEFAKKDNLKDSFNSNQIDEFEFHKANKVNVSISNLCNQFIHSYYFIPFIPEGKSLIGFLICSDYKRKTGIYLITIFDIVDIYRQIGNITKPSDCENRSN